MSTNKRRKLTKQQIRRLKIRRAKYLAVLAALVVGIILIIVCSVRGIKRHIAQKNNTTTQTQTQVQDTSAIPENTASADGTMGTVGKAVNVKDTMPQEVSITISAIGDCTLGTDKDFDPNTSFDAVYASQNDPSYFFSNVVSVLSQDDLTIANLEGALTESTDEQQKTYAFKGKPEYTEILKDGSVEAVNLANNHAHDYGDQGFTDTENNITQAGITSFGYDKTAVVDVKGIKVGLVGIYVLADGLEREQQLKDNIKKVQDEGAQLVIVSFHWGVEKSNYPEETQVTLGHAAVDAGADLVLGHHPHVLEGIETYKGKEIVYSLANFCFGGNKNPSDKDTIIFQQTFTFTDGKLNDDLDTNIIPCTISSQSGSNDYKPTIAEGTEAERILKRVEEYSKDLSKEDSETDTTKTETDTTKTETDTTKTETDTTKTGTDATKTETDTTKTGTDATKTGTDTTKSSTSN